MTVLPTRIIKLSKPIWLIAIIPGLLIAFILAFNIDLSQFGNHVVNAVSFFGALMALFVVFMWALSSKGESYKEVTSEDDVCSPP